MRRKTPKDRSFQIKLLTSANSGSYQWTWFDPRFREVRDRHFTPPRTHHPACRTEQQKVNGATRRCRGLSKAAGLRLFGGKDCKPSALAHPWLRQA